MDYFPLITEKSLHSEASEIFLCYFSVYEMNSIPDETSIVETLKPVMSLPDSSFDSKTIRCGKLVYSSNEGISIHLGQLVHENPQNGEKVENNIQIKMADVVGILEYPLSSSLSLTNLIALLVNKTNSDVSYCYMISFTSTDNSYQFCTYVKDYLKTKGDSNLNSNGNKNKNENITSISADISLDVFEQDGQNMIYSVPRRRDVFMIKRGVKKVIQIFICPEITHEFVVERCFGVLFGMKNDKNQEMQLLDYFDFKKKMKNEETGLYYSITGDLDVMEESFIWINQFNIGQVVPFTFALDVVVQGLIDPIRVFIDVKFKFFNPIDKIFGQSKTKVCRTLVLHLLKNHGSDLLRLKDLEYIDEKSNSSWFTPFDELFNKKSTNKKGESEKVEKKSSEVYDDSIASGTCAFDGEFNEDTIQQWNQAIAEWKNNKSQPDIVSKLIKAGVPGDLRREVWPLLAGIYDFEKYETLYKELLDQKSEFEKVITWDVSRTFPSHDRFKDNDGSGQQLLFRISKAYSNYDKQVGYTQGLSFIIAVLLLHLEEVIAFSLLVEVMYTYKHRDLFKNSFESLQSQLYVLKRLIIDYMPELGRHFSDIGLEPHMYAPQWFLTLFTAKFPLGFVDLAMDNILYLGAGFILQISLGLLYLSRNEITKMNFDETMQFFRSSMPKKYYTYENCKKLMDASMQFNVSHSLIEEISMDYQRYKKEIGISQDPIELLKADNKILFERQLRLEHENDMLAQELVITQIKAQKNIAQLEESINRLKKQLRLSLNNEGLLTETINSLREQEALLKRNFRDLTNKCDENDVESKNVIKKYKRICSQIENRFEESSKNHLTYKTLTQEILLNCNQCAEEFKNRMESFDDDKANDCSQNQTSDIENSPSTPSSNTLINKYDSESRVESLEMELARTKLLLVESECKVQSLQHEFKSNSPSYKSWFSKRS